MTINAIYKDYEPADHIRAAERYERQADALREKHKGVRPSWVSAEMAEACEFARRHRKAAEQKEGRA